MLFARSVAVRFFLLALTFFLLARSDQVEASQQPFVEWLKGLNEEAAKKGIRNEILVSALTGVKLIPRVVELDRKQPEFSLTFSQYMERVVRSLLIL